MVHVVDKSFFDGEDDNFYYRKKEKYPRAGKKLVKKRAEELEKLGFIKKIEGKE